MFPILHNFASLYESAANLRHSFRVAHDEMTSNIFQRAVETVEQLRLKLPPQLANPRVAIVCGSGLGGLADTVNDERQAWEYKDVPNFPMSTGRLSLLRGVISFVWLQTLRLCVVQGHEGKLIFSTMGEHRVPVVLLVGRAQYVVVAASLRRFVAFHLIVLLIRLASTKAMKWTPSPSPPACAKSLASTL